MVQGMSKYCTCTAPQDYRTDTVYTYRFWSAFIIWSILLRILHASRSQKLAWGHTFRPSDLAFPQRSSPLS